MNAPILETAGTIFFLVLDKTFKVIDCMISRYDQQKSISNKNNNTGKKITTATN